jgi:hypothetical protein
VYRVNGVTGFFGIVHAPGKTVRIWQRGSNRQNILASEAAKPRLRHSVRDFTRVLIPAQFDGL